MSMHGLCEDQRERRSSVFYCCGMTDAGTVRKHNEDAFLIDRKIMTAGGRECQIDAPFIAAVADGVSGESSGDVASKMALKLLSADVSHDEEKILSIHHGLQKYGINHRTENMQTTLCALAADPDGKAVMINIGDSRMYLYRHGTIKQLSRDQSLVQMLYEQGHITPEQRINHSDKNIIFPVLGNLDRDPEPQIEEISGGLLHGDIIVICSDGLSDHLTSGEFEDILAAPKKLPHRLKDMVERAKSNGSEDNITVVAVTYLEIC